jgi:RNA polymerase sigma factor (sigma-70 family)
VNEAEIPDLDEHLKNVKHIANRIYKRYGVKGMDLEDLIEEGVLGLYDAFNRFDPDRGVAFKTYARYRVQGTILDSIRRWLPCNHQTNKEERIELIENFQRTTIMNANHKQTNNLEQVITDVANENLIDKLMSPLSEQDRDLLKALICDGDTLSVVSEKLQIPKTQIPTMRDNALRQMRTQATKLGIKNGNKD